MVPSTKVYFIKMSITAEERSSMPVVTLMRESLQKIWPMVLEYINM